MQAKLSDYATWDDTYAYILEKNDSYIQTNFVESTFNTLGLNIVAIVDVSGTVVYAKGYNMQTKTITPVPTSFIEYLKNHRFLTNFQQTTDSAKGLIMLPEGPLLFASCPILTSNVDGPIRGAFIFARYLDEPLIKVLSDNILLPLQISSLNETEVKEDQFNSDPQSIIKYTPIVVLPLDQNNISGSTILADILGRPALRLHINLPRHVYNQGRSSVISFLLVLSIIGIVCIALIFSILKRTAQSEEQFRQLFAQIGEGFIICEIRSREKGNSENKLFIREVNTTFEQMIDRKRNEMIGYSLLDACPSFDSGFIEICESVARTQIPARFETYFTLVDRFFEVIAFSPKRNQVVTILTDISVRKKAETNVQYLTNHDSLTGLYNRHFFEKKLQQFDDEKLYPLSLIVGDLNGLKLINDSFGHYEGDRVLCKTAEVLRQSCRKDDIIARWGGDEFVILFPCVEEKTVRIICDRIRHSLKDKMDYTVPVSIALGTATKEIDGQDIDELFKLAEDRMYKNKNLERDSVRHNIIKSLKQSLQKTHFETEEHPLHLQMMSLEMGRSLNFTNTQLNNLMLLSALHDIGKISIKKSILLKPTQLTSQEWEEIKKHPEIGYRIITSCQDFQPIAEGILTHHERWDGKGYPQGLKGNAIPLSARIIAIIDAFDVMTSGRPYRKVISSDEALEELRRCSGTQFDPELVEIFINVFGKSNIQYLTN